MKKYRCVKSVEIILSDKVVCFIKDKIYESDIFGFMYGEYGEHGCVLTSGREVCFKEIHESTYIIIIIYKNRRVRSIDFDDHDKTIDFINSLNDESSHIYKMWDGENIIKYSVEQI